MFNIKKTVSIAADRIKPYFRKTMLDHSLPLSNLLGCQVFLKCENLQYTGSFKVRGALNKLLSLTPSERLQGVTTASTGNHAAAVAFGVNKLNIPSLVFVPENASKTKIDNILNYHIPLKHHGSDCMVTELYAREYAAKNHMIYISPYNDLEVIAGQGTIAIELMEQLNKIDAVFVPIGGGGLISGIAGYLKETASHIKMIGCLPENSPVMAESIQAGRILDIETKKTLSDATAGGIEPGSVTFEICQKYVDDYILVSEQEIKQAIISIIKSQHLLIEGASGVALAALFKKASQLQNKNVVVILSGANISLDNLSSVLDHYENN